MELHKVREHDADADMKTVTDYWFIQTANIRNSAKCTLENLFRHLTPSGFKLKTNNL